MLEFIQGFIAEFGHLAVFLWAFIEGEVGMVLAGSLAHEGYLNYRWVVAMAFLGGFLGDQFYFWLGRRYGMQVFARWPRLRAPAMHARNLLARYNTAFILSNRFMYGVRIVGPIVVGTTPIPAVRFFWLNMLSAAVWAVSVTGLGYLFADAVERVIENLHVAESLLLGGLVTLGLAIWLFRRR